MIPLSQGETAVSRQDEPHLRRLPPFLRQRCSDRQVSSSYPPFESGAGQGVAFFVQQA